MTLIHRKRGRVKKYIQNLVGRADGRGSFRRPKIVEGKTVLKQTLEKNGAKIWTQFITFTIHLSGKEP